MQLIKAKLLQLAGRAEKSPSSSVLCLQLASWWSMRSLPGLWAPLSAIWKLYYVTSVCGCFRNVLFKRIRASLSRKMLLSILEWVIQDAVDTVITLHRKHSKVERFGELLLKNNIFNIWQSKWNFYSIIKLVVINSHIPPLFVQTRNLVFTFELAPPPFLWKL